MRLRVRGPEGQVPITLPSDATISTLLSEIRNATSLETFDIKYGYPPRTLDLEGRSQSTALSALQVKLDGEQLILTPKEPTTTSTTGDKAGYTSHNIKSQSQPNIDEGDPKLPSNSAAPLTLKRKAQIQDTPEVPAPSHAATVVLRVMPDDNSCLFRAFSSAFFGSELDSMHELRSIVAQAIQADPITYNEAVLDKKPDAYCRWIQNQDAWGGGIELSILSQNFDVEICSIDVQTLRIDRFGEDKAKRVILVYSGVHYDVVALSPNEPPFANATAPPEFDLKMFDAADEDVVDYAVQLCRTLQSQHYFTDTAGFSIKCNVCGGTFVGEKGATEHATLTGHYDFAEAS